MWHHSWIRASGRIRMIILGLVKEAQWPIGYGVGLRIKRSSVRIRPWPPRWVLGQGSLLPLSQGEAFTLASISYPAILVKYILAKKKKKKKKKTSTTEEMDLLDVSFAAKHPEDLPRSKNWPHLDLPWQASLDQDWERLFSCAVEWKSF